MVKEQTVIIPTVLIQGRYYPTGIAVAHEECECEILDLLEEVGDIYYE